MDWKLSLSAPMRPVSIGDAQRGLRDVGLQEPHPRLAPRTDYLDDPGGLQHRVVFRDPLVPTPASISARGPSAQAASTVSATCTMGYVDFPAGVGIPIDEEKFSTTYTPDTTPRP